MTALAARPERCHGAGAPALARPSDRSLLLLAGGAACLLHLAVVFIPLPSTQSAPPPPPDVSDPPIVTRTPITPPPLALIDPPQPRRAPSRLLFVSMDIVPDGEPLREAEPSTTAGLTQLKPEPILNHPVAPPQEPSVFDETTVGLVLPQPSPGRPEPDYPPLAVRTRSEGQVVLQAVITGEGRIDSIEVVRAPRPDLGMTDAAIEAVSRWEYTPGSLHGRPVAVGLTVIVDFILD